MHKFTIKNGLEHLKVVMRHRRWVRHFCFKAHLYRQGLMHDLSKYNPTEFIESVKYFVGTSSPIDACKKDKGYSAAWMHHKSHNKHHREYWTDNYDKGTTCVKMPWRYALECFCDFLGAGKAYNPKKFTPKLEFDWWKQNRLNMKINLDTRMLLDVLFIAYVGCGESILSDKLLIDSLRTAYESTDNTQSKIGKAILSYQYSLGSEFMRNFSYDYPTWRVDPLVRQHIGGLFDWECEESLTEDELMTLRETCHKITKDKHNDTLTAWCKEAGVKTPIGYYLDYTDGIYYIYTDKPGYLIGKAGCLVNKYQQLLQTKFSGVKSVKFVEIKGGFSNYVDD